MIVRLGDFTKVSADGAKMWSGGYDPSLDTVFVGRGGHFDGMAQAGGHPDPGRTPGMTVLQRGDEVIWANDSVSLPLALDATVVGRIQQAMETAFPGCHVKQVECANP